MACAGPAEPVSKDERAVVKLNAKVAENPDHLLAWVLLTYVNSRMGRLHAARRAAEQVERINLAFSVVEFSEMLGFTSEESRKRFVDYCRTAGLE
jgi:hypothetical protein